MHYLMIENGWTPIKQQLSQTNHQDSLNDFLDKSINPTEVKLTHADAICFFFAYLTDLIGQELEVAHKLVPLYTP